MYRCLAIAWELDNIGRNICLFCFENLGEVWSKNFVSGCYCKKTEVNFFLY